MICFFLFRFALRPGVVCLNLMHTIRASDGRARGTARLKTDRVVTNTNIEVDASKNEQVLWFICLAGWRGLDVSVIK